LQNDRIVATADGTGITLSDIRRQVDPNMSQLRAGAKNDAELKKAILNAEEEVLNSIADRLLVIAEFRASTSGLPASYIDANIEDTIRRDFNGDRNRFVASLRAAGTTPLAHRKRIEDSIIFDYMVSQIRRAAWREGDNEANGPRGLRARRQGRGGKDGGQDGAALGGVHVVIPRKFRLSIDQKAPPCLHGAGGCHVTCLCEEGPAWGADPSGQYHGGAGVFAAAAASDGDADRAAGQHAAQPE
jgi:hypothetical protein